MPHPDMSESWVNGHPDEGLLHEWLDEQLSVDDAQAVETHVAGCDDCRALVAEARGLIAASHRILSALDDVPANVVPAQASLAATENGVASLEAARTAREAGNAAGQTLKPSRWRNAGKVAALLLVALIPGVFLLRGDDVTVPMASLRDAAVADSSVQAAVATAAPVAAAAPVTAPPSQVAGVGAAQSASKASAQPDRQRFAGALSKSATAEREPSPAEQPARAEADRRVAAAEPTSPANAAAVTLPTTPPPAVAADQLAQAQQGQRMGSGGRGGGGGRGATRQADSLSASPIPLAANAIAARSAPPLGADSASLTRQIAEAAKRVAARTSGVSENRQLGAVATPATPSLQFRSAGPNSLTFDSVTLTRTTCSTACETAVLRISEPGAVRYAVSSGSSAKPAITSQLPEAARVRISELLGATFAQQIATAGSVRCTISSATGAPSLEIVVVNSAGNRLRAEAPCTTSEATLRQLGAAIDEVAGTEALRRRVP